MRVIQGEQITQMRAPHQGYLNFPLFLGKTWFHSYKNLQLSGDVMRSVRLEVKKYE